jgi:hypothetical protein
MTADMPPYAHPTMRMRWGFESVRLPKASVTFGSLILKELEKSDKRVRRMSGVE